jgi:hypothetical protein
MRGVEERGMRRTFKYAAVTSDNDNEADGSLRQPQKAVAATLAKAGRPNATVFFMELTCRKTSKR